MPAAKMIVGSSFAFAREKFSNIFLADFGFGRRNGVFFEMDERCSSVIAVKCQGTR
jgi:hypothetical protein